jgi:hypothetical protein
MGGGEGKGDYVKLYNSFAIVLFLLLFNHQGIGDHLGYGLDLYFKIIFAVKLA